jgi:hypothetical protein
LGLGTRTGCVLWNDEEIEREKVSLLAERRLKRNEVVRQHKLGLPRSVVVARRR